MGFRVSVCIGRIFLFKQKDNRQDRAVTVLDEGKHTTYTRPYVLNYPHTLALAARNLPACIFFSPTNSLFA